MGAEMTKNRFKWSAMTAAFVAASLASSVALAAQTEAESTADNTCNNTLAQATPLEFDGSGVAVVNGTMINGYGYNGLCDTWAASQYRDIDFYSFEANADEDLDIAISDAWNGKYTWAVLGIYGPTDSTNHHPLLRHVDVLYNADGTVNFEPFLTFHANAAGTYYVGVSSYPGFFYYPDGRLLMYSVYGWSPDGHGTPGPYMLTVKGAKPPVQQISIDVKPGNDNVTVLDADGAEHPAAVRGVARGHLPVALLSSKNDDGVVVFDATKVDQSTLRFGATGKEDSLVSCNGGRGVDVNHDGLPDLICHFDMKKANFALTESEGTLTGKTGDGKDFEGTGWLKVVTVGLTPEKMKMGRGHKK